jgi:hypothetical protein
MPNRSASGENEPYAIGPDGTRLTRADLPPPDTRRWVPRRKAEVVAAVRDGLLELSDALGLYDISLTEFKSWEETMAAHGMGGLRTTRLRQYKL